MDLEAQLKEMHGAWNELKKSNDAAIKAMETKGSVPSELTAKIEKLNETISNQEAEVKKMQTAMNRLSAGGDTKTSELSEKDMKYAKEFKHYMKRGGNETELKTMSADSEQDGGLLVTPEMSSEIVKKVFETSEMRSYASVQSISSGALDILEDLDEASVGWVNENQSRPSTGTPKLNKISIPVHEIYAMPAATQQLLDDAGINIESWLAGKVSEKFARTENTAFISGDGASKPQGILSYAAGTAFKQVEQVNSGSATGLSADGLVNFVHVLKTPYAKSAKLFMNRQTIKSARVLKDSQNRYLWAPGLDGSTSGSLLGYEVVEFADMPIMLGTGGELAIVHADMKQAYQIVDRIGVRVLRDPFTSKPYILFYTTKRVGGGVKNFEALKLLKIAL